jgi:uncharacterized LabA/DUF88 family protein
MDRVYFFIDGSNFYKGITCQGLKGWDATHVDLKAFCLTLLDAQVHKLVRIYYYDAPLKQAWDPKRYSIQQNYFQRLKDQDNVELVLGRLEGKYPNVREKGIDVKLSVDLIRFAHNNSYDSAVIISADGDYTPAFQLAKDMGKEIYNAYFPKIASFHLRNIVDKFIPIDINQITSCQLQQQPLFPKTTAKQKA